MAKQMKKYMAVTTASLMAMQLSACGNSETQTMEETNTPVDTPSTSANNNQVTSEEGLLNVHNSEMADACEEWRESDDGSFECLDENSPYYAQHFFNGLMYATAGAMIGSAIYKSKNLKNGTERDENSGRSAGAATTTTNKSNSITTGGSSSSSTGASSSGGNIDLNKSTSNSSTANGTNSNATTTSGTNANSSGTNSYSSGQRSYSNGTSSSSSNTSNSYSSSSSTGKSGFGSGGASRGGSSSS
ncbi:hypothetical protein ACIQXI_09840 [Lysinibacillus sp. NPDC097195]|uniref:hypothetical protein n=1 Tax=Lysinibacillus sp. NPDC097195 TaxID=3364141 RepID=UPI003800D703